MADIVSYQPSISKTQIVRSRNTLRPHYKMVLEAFESERDGKGLTDAAIIEFFENYVHNSLAAFAMDATLPSDPRIVYVGFSKRLDYAARGTLEQVDQMA